MIESDTFMSTLEVRHKGVDHMAENRETPNLTLKAESL